VWPRERLPVGFGMHSWGSGPGLPPVVVSVKPRRLCLACIPWAQPRLHITWQSTRTPKGVRSVAALLAHLSSVTGHFYVRLHVRARHFCTPGVTLALFGLLAACAPNAEVIELVALDPIILVAPNSVAGVALNQVGALAAGQRTYVTGCNARKSDIDIQVSWNGISAVAWSGKYRLERRDAKPTEAHAIRSCSGLLLGTA
jgi:hypothetical protein